MDFFHCYHRQWISFPWNLSISASPTSVTTHSYRCYRQKFNPKLSYFHHLEGGRVSAVHEKASPNENAKQTAIHHRSLVPRGRFARGSVPQMLCYIYPPSPPDRGVLNRYFPSQDTPQRWRARILERSPVGGVGLRGLSLERVRCDMGTLQPHGKRQIVFYADHPRRAAPMNYAAFILKVEENKKQLMTINPKMAERGGNLKQKQSSQRDLGREECLRG